MIVQSVGIRTRLIRDAMYVRVRAEKTVQVYAPEYAAVAVRANAQDHAMVLAIKRV